MIFIILMRKQRTQFLNSFPVFPMWFRGFSELELAYTHGFEDESLEGEAVVRLSSTGVLASLV